MACKAPCRAAVFSDWLRPVRPGWTRSSIVSLRPTRHHTGVSGRRRSQQVPENGPPAPHPLFSWQGRRRTGCAHSTLPCNRPAGARHWSRPLHEAHDTAFDSLKHENIWLILPKKRTAECVLADVLVERWARGGRLTRDPPWLSVHGPPGRPNTDDRKTLSGGELGGTGKALPLIRRPRIGHSGPGPHLL